MPPVFPFLLVKPDCYEAFSAMGKVGPDEHRSRGKVFTSVFFFFENLPGQFLPLPHCILSLGQVMLLLAKGFKTNAFLETIV